MPKLSSRSKHEEFKSNSALKIKDQKERREKSEEKHHCRKASPASTIHSFSTVHPAAPVLLHFTHLLFLLQFLVSSDINTCNSFSFSFFCNFPCSESYIS